jgi:GrpB-like predicted nucleotidyltransferase (UPF0157 family)
MSEGRKPHGFDLEERCFQFARRVRRYLKRLPRVVSNYEDGR